MNPLQDQLGRHPKLPQKFGSRAGNGRLSALRPRLHLQIKRADMACIHTTYLSVPPFPFQKEGGLIGTARCDSFAPCCPCAYTLPGKLFVWPEYCQATC